MGQLIQPPDSVPLVGSDELASHLVVGDLWHHHADALVKEAKRPCTDVPRIPGRRGIAEQTQGSAVEDDQHALEGTVFGSAGVR